MRVGKSVIIKPLQCIVQYYRKGMNKEINFVSDFHAFYNLGGGRSFLTLVFSKSPSQLLMLDSFRFYIIDVAQPINYF